MQILGWQPKALTIDELAFYAGLIVMFAFALIIGLWNLTVFLWMKNKWRSIAKILTLDFPKYLSDDPTG